MASPQKEEGSTMIANEVLEKIYSFPFTNSELRVLLFIIRKTWGWHKKEDKISYKQIANSTSTTRRNAIYLVKSLVKKQALFVKSGYINTISFNKDYDKWVVKKQALVKESALPSEETSTTLVKAPSPKLVKTPSPTKDNKETIQNKLLQKKGVFISPSLTEDDFIYISNYYKVPISFVRSEYEDILLWIAQKPNNPKLKDRNWKMTLMAWVKKDGMKIIERSKGDPTKRATDARNL